MDGCRGRVRKRVRQDAVYMKRKWRSFNWSKNIHKGTVKWMKEQWQNTGC